MTRERAAELAPIINAYGEGEEIEFLSGVGNWLNVRDDKLCNGEFVMDEGCQYRIKPTPSLRPMTRGEVLYMVTTTPGMVVHTPDGIVGPASGCAYKDAITDYEYAIIDKYGNPIDGWHKFETAEPMPDGWTEPHL